MFCKILGRSFLGGFVKNIIAYLFEWFIYKEIAIFVLPKLCQYGRTVP